MDVWFTGAGDQIEFEEIMKIIDDHTNKNGRIFIGTDSFNLKNKCIMASAVCLHGAEGSSGGRYFIKRTKLSKNKFPSVLTRILHEVNNTIQLALSINEANPDTNIELHLDISASSKGEVTSKFADMLTGYAKSSGFDYKIKPDAFAAASVADRHSK
tara:strand:- start:419 stop:889 length:471 start_codon:yes stop_codon:yes gene_type:complete